MLTEDHILEFQKKGFTVLKNGLQEQELNLLHEEADILSNYLMSEGFDLITDLGCINGYVEPWTCGYLDLPETNYYKTDAYKYSSIRDTIYWPNTCTTTASHIVLHKYGDYAAQLLDQEIVYLLNEQFIIKPPMRSSISSSFAWHKDSDYYQDDRHRNIGSIACWTALNSVTEYNGTIEIEDFLGTHHTICVEAGSIVFMSDQLVHKSTCNLSNKFRRVYMNQFSVSPLLYYSESDEQCVALAVPSPFQNSLDNGNK